VIDHQHDDEHQLGREPAATGTDAVADPQPHPE
jgi:hypothetical protein